MTVALQQKIKVLRENIRGNSRRIEQQLSSKPETMVDKAIIASAAKYLGTLKKLAQE
jgi:hypothetical protein